MLQTVDYQLIFFLSKIFNNSELPKIIYNGLHNSVLSNSIPLDYYKKIVYNNLNFLDFRVKDIYESFHVSDYTIYNISTLLKER